MEKEEKQDEDVKKKMNSIQYRHVNKKLSGKIKQQYNMKPGFYTSIKAPSGEVKGKNVVTITMKTGSTYTGEVNENYERNGQGVQEVINGGLQKGQWINGFKHGQGIFYYRDGTLQQDGDWQFGEPHGNGKVYNMRGNLVFAGNFKNGKSKSGIYWLDYKNK